EAKGHTGGNSGKGGDILYRWGNPQNYNAGDSDDRYLYFQHNPNWIKHGIHKNKIAIYDNGFTRPGNYSTGIIIDPPIDENGNYLLFQDCIYEPFSPEPHLENINDYSLFSEYTSGFKVLENGNYFITEEATGNLLEVTPDGNIVWEYATALRFVFRTEKYSENYLGFEGKDLNPIMDAVPNSNSDFECDIFTSLEDFEDSKFVEVLSLENEIKIENHFNQQLQISLISSNGMVLNQFKSSDTFITISKNHLSKGIYIVNVRNKKGDIKSFKFFH
ncbi:MAG: T9SS type A sorting domain-containing protein, partial [Bacteroidota bacterium]